MSDRMTRDAIRTAVTEITHSITTFLSTALSITFVLLSVVWICYFIYNERTRPDARIDQYLELAKRVESLQQEILRLDSRVDQLESSRKAEADGLTLATDSLHKAVTSVLTIKQLNKEGH